VRRFACVMMVGMAMGCSAQKMVHPGVVVSGAQLAYVKAQVATKQGPVYAEFQKAVASEYAALDYKMKGPPPEEVIECGPVSNPDHGCHAEDADATAAYLQSVLWTITGDHRYAENAIRIVNAYSHLRGYTNSNAPLQSAWSGELWPRSAEILRWTNAGWKHEDQVAFAKMLVNVILPEIYNGSDSNGNWELSMIDAMMGIAVFVDNRPLLEHAEAMWMERVPAYFYVEALDGKHPAKMPQHDRTASWYGTTDLNASVDGISQETCRDLNHTGYGIAATMNAAETAHIQGGKLYEAMEKRLVPALEFHAKLFLAKEPVPKLVCGGRLNPGKGYTFTIGYNEYHNRLGVDLPFTKEWLEHVYADPDQVDMHMIVFEGLTHGGDAGSAK